MSIGRLPIFIKSKLRSIKPDLMNIGTRLMSVGRKLRAINFRPRVLGFGAQALIFPSISRLVRGEGQRVGEAPATLGERGPDLTFFRETFIMVCVREIESRKEHHDRAPLTPRPIHVFEKQRTGYARAVPSRRPLLGRPVSSVRREGLQLSRLFYFLLPFVSRALEKKRQGAHRRGNTLSDNP